MNGLRNGIFIISLMILLVVVDYMYTTTDIITGRIYNATNASFSNPITDDGYATYTKMRELMYGAITTVLVPFLIFLSFFSSAVNRNQSLHTYLLSAFVIVIFTPLAIYLVSEIITNMLNVSILDHDYMASVFLNNFMWIMVANMLLTLGSFVFINKGGQVQ